MPILNHSGMEIQAVFIHARPQSLRKSFLLKNINFRRAEELLFGLRVWYEFILTED